MKKVLLSVAIVAAVFALTNARAAESTETTSTPADTTKSSMQLYAQADTVKLQACGSTSTDTTKSAGMFMYAEEAPADTTKKPAQMNLRAEEAPADTTKKPAQMYLRAETPADTTKTAQFV